MDAMLRQFVAVSTSAMEVVAAQTYRKTPEYAKVRAEAISGDDDAKMPDAQLEDFLFHFTAEEYLSRIFEREP